MLFFPKNKFKFFYSLMKDLKIEDLNRDLMFLGLEKMVLILESTNI